MAHPLHLAVAAEVQKYVNKNVKLISDPACGGKQLIPLFIGNEKSSISRMCCVDLLIVKNAEVRVILEIEESGFLPTKICGKFLQAALADHYIHDSIKLPDIPYSGDVLFIQVLDSSKYPKGSKKITQATKIESSIRRILPLRSITEYKLFSVNGENDSEGLAIVGKAVEANLS